MLFAMLKFTVKSAETNSKLQLSKLRKKQGNNY